MFHREVKASQDLQPPKDHPGGETPANADPGQRPVVSPEDEGPMKEVVHCIVLQKENNSQ